MGFKSNGKPGRIYHWNLPVLKKMLSKGDGRKSSNLRHSNDVNDLIDIQHIPTWSNPWDDNNETIEKAFSGKQNAVHNIAATSNSAQTTNINGLDDDFNLKLFKKKTPTYYAPAKQKKKIAIVDHKETTGSNKYFPGNGKPKSFYVIKKNQHKPFYQKLIP